MSERFGNASKERIEKNCSKEIQSLVMKGPEEDGSWNNLYVWQLREAIVNQDILLNFYKWNFDERILRQADPKKCVCKSKD
jgi:hypothetical protein